MTRNIILYAEDFEELRTGLARFISDKFEKYTVEAFPDGEQLAQRLELMSDDVGLVLTDNDMPRRSGLNVIRNYAAKFPEIPFILFSGDYEAGAKAKNYGARDFVEKGNLEGLTKVLETYLNLSQ